jgi:hypothetical protein
MLIRPMIRGFLACPPLSVCKKLIVWNGFCGFPKVTGLWYVFSETKFTDLTRLLHNAQNHKFALKTTKQPRHPPFFELSGQPQRQPAPTEATDRTHDPPQPSPPASASDNISKDLCKAQFSTRCRFCLPSLRALSHSRSRYV